jgi:hypothetical protein
MKEQEEAKVRKLDKLGSRSVRYLKAQNKYFGN